MEAPWRPCPKDRCAARWRIEQVDAGRIDGKKYRLVSPVCKPRWQAGYDRLFTNLHRHHGFGGRGLHDVDHPRDRSLIGRNGL